MRKFSIFDRKLAQSKLFKKYLRVWWKTTLFVFSADLANRGAAGLLLVGKLLRFLFFLGFLILLTTRTKTLAGYNLSQVVFFFLTFNLVDITVQFLLRGIYHFRPLIIKGNFDFYLTKPLNPLFQSLTSHTDILDLITLVPLILYLIFFLASGKLIATLTGIFLYCLLVFNAFLIALAFHIVVLAIGILTAEVDHLIWIYRDLTGTGRIPVDIYRPPLRAFLTFIIPVGMMMTFPAKALMGLLQPWLVIFSLIFAGLFLYLALRFWHFALKRYTSASS